MILATAVSLMLAANTTAANDNSAEKPDVSVRLEVVRTVENRQPIGGGPFVSGEKAIAWTAVTGMKDGFVEHVWSRNGKEVARHYLPIQGNGKKPFRTWSRHQLRDGSYTIEVLAPDGALLAKSEIVVASGALSQATRKP